MEDNRYMSRRTANMFCIGVAIIVALLMASQLITGGHYNRWDRPGAMVKPTEAD